MSVMSELAAAAIARPVNLIDAAWSTDPRVLQEARALKLTAWAFYVGSRGGVLGDDVCSDTVAAAIGLIAPDAVHSGWQAAQAAGASSTAAKARLGHCAGWGQDRLIDLVDERLVTLIEKVVKDADATALPLFAATRARCAGMAHPGLGARAALGIHLLREMRAGGLLIAARASRMRPVELLIAGPEGEQEATTFGWTPPFPTRASVARHYAHAQAIADRLCGNAFEVLGPGERTELVDGIKAVAAGVGSA